MLPSLVTFVDESGITTFGDPWLENGDELELLLAWYELSTMKLLGDGPFDLERTNEESGYCVFVGVIRPVQMYRPQLRQTQ